MAIPTILTRAFVIAAVTVAAGCHRNPALTYAHLLERAASWSASARFANELVRRGDAPRPYLHDVFATGAKELSSISDQIETTDDVASEQRSADAAACRKLAALFQAADGQAPLGDDRALRDAESQLRTAAARARRGAILETRR